MAPGGPPARRRPSRHNRDATLRARPTSRVFRSAALAIALAAGATGATAADEDSARRADELRALRERIEALQQRQEQTRGERDSAQAALRAAEREVGRRLAEIKRLNDDHRRQSRRLDILERAQRDQRAGLQRERAALERALRLAHRLGPQAPLRMLLTPADPAVLARTRTYARYLHEARARRISATRDALGRLRAGELALTRQLAELDGLRRAELGHKQQLDAARTERARVYAELGDELRRQARELERLRRDERELGNLIRQLGAVARDQPMPRPGGRFGAARGRLALPTPGKISARFGEPRGQGDLKWKGIFVSAPEGQEVRAVFPGRVLYADWLRGLGLLLVLDHGDGYMTLYGHNQSLYRKIGEQVEAGQTIGSVGATGGAALPGLYFEVRQDGEPRDPMQWCKVR